tara:strand:- start:2196 stop:4181 length:1986 start_codon:yes stop_codon:yes gene_type:complete
MALTNLEKTILDTIAYFEGTIGKSANGYDLLFGGKKVMNGWESDTTIIRHRCVQPHGTISKKDIEDAGYTVCQDPTWKDSFQVNGTTKYSTAAGRYQYLGWAWWDSTKRANLSGIDLNAPMSKDNQDRIANWAVKKKGVTENDLKNALNSLSSFKSLIKKLEKKWESFEKSLSDPSYHKTPENGWTFYKGAYEKYNSPSTGTQSHLSSSGSGLVYIDSDGKTIPKFGTSKTSSNTADSDKFYVNIPSDSTVTNIIYFWCGLESVIARKKQWDQIPSNVKNKNYIIMGNYLPNVDGNTDISNNGLRNPFKRYFTSIGGNFNKIKTKMLMGYSAGGALVFNNYSKTNDKFCALIDPSLSTTTNTEDRTYGGNVAMLWGSTGMKNIGNPKWSTRYPKVQTKIKAGNGYSVEVPNLNHSIAIQKWFELWGDVVTTGQSPINNQSSNCSSNPNASYLRQVMATLNYKEKIYVNGSAKYIVPSLDTSTGCYKLKTTNGFEDGEMSNGGDINEKLSKITASIFTEIKEKYQSYIIIVTGGNDKHHHTLNYNSRHKQGRGMDIIIDGASRSCTTDSNWGKVSKPETKVQKVINIVRGFTASGSGGKLYDELRYIDEYCNKSAAATGDHIHWSFGGSGSDYGRDRIELAKTESDKNPSQLETFNVGDLFT